MKPHLLLIAFFFAAVQLASASPRELTFSDNQQGLSFQVRATQRDDKSGLVLYSIRFDPSFGRDPSASLELHQNGKVTGAIQLYVFEDSVTKSHLSAFQLARDWPKDPVLWVQREEKPFGKADFKIKLSTWPVRVLHPKAR